MLASMPSLLAGQLMRDFARSDIPLTAKARTLAELPMYMVWHQRFQKDPAHSWLRAQLEDTAVRALAGEPSRIRRR
jgi:DNA-binding transcriptional LysR family regulator